MRHRSSTKIFCATVAFGFSFAAQGAVVWNESVNGDFSNNGLLPTEVDFTLGTNTILGVTGNSGLGVDRDYFTFTVPTGTVLASLILLGNSTVSGSSSFIGLQAGPQLTVTPTGGGAENLLGFVHYGSEHIGMNLMALLAPGFPDGAPSGAYSVWIQELGGPVEYGFDFGITASPVPLPAAGALLLSALLGLGTLRRRTTSSR